MAANGVTTYRKKPVEIEAVLFTEDTIDDAIDFVGAAGRYRRYPNEAIEIQTIEGRMTASLGDWIIKGVKGEFYPCKPDIFEATYEQVS